MLKILLSLTFLLSFYITDTAADRVDELIAQLYGTLDNARSDLSNPLLWPLDYEQEFRDSGPVTHDYIVIGAGSAGSVVASRLSEDPNASVLVLEAGGDPPLLSEVHSLSLLLANTSHTWNDFAQPNPTSCQAMKDGRCFWLRGKMIGGTGGVNAGIFLPGLPEDYDEWQQQGNFGWSWDNVYPYFTKATEDLGTSRNPMGSLILNNFVRLPDFNALKDIMTNSTEENEMNCDVKSPGFKPDILATVDRGKRMSTGKTYLGKVSRHRPLLHVLRNAMVTKILVNRRKKAIGVEFLLNGNELFRIQAKREIILSAGAFNSPKILMLSGIGPCKHLRDLNLTCLHNLPVGRSFQDHGMMPLPLRFTRNVPTPEQSNSVQNMFDFLVYQKGPLAANRNLVGIINTLNKSDILITSSITQPSSESNLFKTLQFKDELTTKFVEKSENQTLLELVGLVIKPKSRGYIQLKSSNPFDGPLIYNKHGQIKEDRDKLLRFIRYIQDLVHTPTFKYYGLELHRIPVEECDTRYTYDSNDYWFCYIKYFFISAWHAAGTCRMAPESTGTGVVDSQLRVHGIKGLRVIDASIMPNITSGNTNGPTIMIAEKGSHMIQLEYSNSVGV